MILRLVANRVDNSDTLVKRNPFTKNLQETKFTRTLIYYYSLKY